MDEIDMYFKQLEEYREPIDITIDINDFGRKKTKETEPINTVIFMTGITVATFAVPAE